MIGLVEVRYSKARRVSGLPPCKRRPITYAAKSLPPFIRRQSTAGILLLFFFSKETGKKSSKITRSRLLLANEAVLF
jgi:hypothetical protein